MESMLDRFGGSLLRFDVLTKEGIRESVPDRRLKLKKGSAVCRWKIDGRSIKRVSEYELTIEGEDEDLVYK